MKEQTIKERENDPRHIAVCLNDLANRLKQMAKYLDKAGEDAMRIAINLSRKK